MSIEKAIDSIQRLQAATTPREAYEIEFPVVAGRTNRIDLFNDFMETEEQSHFCHLTITPENNAQWSRENKNRKPKFMHPAFHKPMATTLKVELAARRLSDAKFSKRDLCLAFQTYKSKGTSTLHTDRPPVYSRRWLCSVDRPTWVIPHEAALRIFEQSPYAYLLDEPIGGDIIEDRVFFVSRDMPEGGLQNRDDLNAKLARAAIQLNPGDIAVMASGFTYHYVDPTHPGKPRVLYSVDALPQ